jgi:ribosomal protein S12 methylthiotransferase
MQAGEDSRPGSRFSVVSLGCAKNTVDSEAIRSLLAARGYVDAGDDQGADLLVVNTCGFIDQAKQESIDTLLQLGTQKREGQRLIATGCLTERYAGDVAAEIPEIDAVVGARNWGVLPMVADHVIDEPTPREPGSSLKLVEIAPSGYIDLEMPRRVATGPSAFVKISDGCNQKCAFCAIPSMKGLLRTKSRQAILREVGELLEQGVREIVLVSQDSTNHGRDLGETDGLARLLEAITDAHPDMAWVRVMYAYPSHVTERFLRVMAERPQICNYIDMPLQHTHPDVLRRMRRPAGSVERLVGKMRSIVPDLTIRTTFITGFPGETEAEHRQLRHSIEALGFDRVGVFLYSDEEGTAAFKLPNRVPRGVKQRRRHELMTTAREASARANAAMVGKTVDVLVEGSGELDGSPVSVGRSRRDAPEVDGVVFVTGETRIGQIVPVKVDRAMDYDLIGTRAMQK